MIRYARGRMVVGLAPPVLCAALLLLGTAGPARGQVFRLPDTGQTKCYSRYEPHDEIPCAGTGQDGEYSINPLSYTGNGDGTVTDNNTGLIWQKEDDGAAYNWYRASGTSHATYNRAGESVCGSLGLARHSDWRLPTKKELMSLVDYAIPNPGPTIRSVFTNTRSYGYWSSTPLLASPAYAWMVGFASGLAGEQNKQLDLYVRCVRGGQAPAPTFGDNGDGTVTDSRTGHVWQQDVSDFLVWGAALSYCGDLTLAGQSDWRMPNIKELESLTDSTRRNPAIDTTKFLIDDARQIFWSSTSVATSPGGAWNVHFLAGQVFDSAAKGALLVVRCVRGGQSGSLVSGRVRLASAGAQDGWVLESTERSGRGGSLNARANTLRVGDDREDRQYRGVLSFDTSGLPDNAVISGATLSYNRQGVVGADPFGTHGALLGDIIRGAFSGSATLQLTDFQAAPSLRAAIPSFAELSDGWYSADLSETARSFVNKRGRTQVRLRFTKDDNDDRGADYLLIYSGNAAADLRPVLEVTYTIP